MNSGKTTLLFNILRQLEGVSHICSSINNVIDLIFLQLGEEGTESNNEEEEETKPEEVQGEIDTQTSNISKKKKKKKKKKGKEPDTVEVPAEVSTV